MHIYLYIGLPWCLSGKESTWNAGDAGSIPGSGRSHGEGNGNPLQYSCLGSLTDRGAWWAIQSMGSQKSQTWLSDWTTATTFIHVVFVNFPSLPYFFPILFLYRMCYGDWLCNQIQRFHDTEMQCHGLSEIVMIQKSWALSWGCRSWRNHALLSSGK